jgi:hypothetical protein
MDAHLEQLSMIFCTFLFAWTYGWLEANAIEPYWRMYQGTYGHLPWWTRLVLWNQFGFYQLVFAILTLSVTFSFGLIKIHRMFKQKKRYLVMTALGNFALSCLVLDISYFVYHSIETLKPGIWTTWPFGGLWVGKIYVPWWYFVSVLFVGTMFFLAYRSALYNLLLEREVEQRLVTQAAQQPEEPRELGPEPTPQEPAPPAPREDLGDHTPIEKLPEIEPTPTPEEEIRRRLLVKKELQDA